MAPRAVPINLFGNPQQQPQGPSFVDTLLARFMAGLQIGQTVNDFRTQSEARKQQIEQHKLDMEIKKHELSQAKLQELLAPEEAKIRIAQALSGSVDPGSFNTTVNPQQIDVPGMANVPQFLGGPGGYQPSGLSTTFGQAPATYGTMNPVAPMRIDLSAIGGGQRDMPILNRQQAQNQGMRDLLSKLNIEAQGAASKAGATAAAEFPFKAAIEKQKQDSEAAVRANTQAFDAGQKALDRSNSRGNALIAAGGQTVSVDTVDENGQPITLVLPKANAVGKSFKKALTGEAANKVNAATQSLAALDDIEQKFLPDYVGPIAGRLYGAAEATGIGVNPGQSEFSATVAAFNNSVINSLSGAAVTPSEWARLQKQLPQTTDPPAVFKSKINATRDNLLRLQKAQLVSGQIPLRAGALNVNAPAPKMGGTVPNGQIVYDPQGRPHRIVNGQPVPVQ